MRYSEKEVMLKLSEALAKLNDAMGLCAEYGITVEPGEFIELTSCVDKAPRLSLTMRAGRMESL